MKAKKVYYVIGFEQPFDRYNTACTFAREQGLDRSSVSTTAPIASEAPTEFPEVAQSDNNIVDNQESVNAMSNTSIAVIETTSPIEAIVPEAAKTPAPTFRLILGRKVRAGFETVLMAELAKGPGTTVELVDRMLASGEFNRVAPMAATKRPFKPTNFLLKQWVAEGFVTTEAAPEVTDLVVAETVTQ